MGAGGEVAGERTLQEDYQHPERLLSVLVENKEQECCYVVHALAVTDYWVMGGIGPQSHGQGLLPMALLEEGVLGERPRDVKLNLLDMSLVVCVGDRQRCAGDEVRCHILRS